MATNELSPEQRARLGRALVYLIDVLGRDDPADDPPAEAEPARADDDKNQSGQRDDC